MNESIALSVVTREKSLFDERVSEVTIPAENGEMQALPLHTPYIARLSVGELSFTLDGGLRKIVLVTGGFVEVLPDQVTVLVRTAEFPKEIDATRAEEARKRAEKRLMNPTNDTDLERARAALTRAIARLKLVGNT